MEEPCSNLQQGNLPKYSLGKIESKEIGVGTKINIENYLMNSPEKSYNFHTMKDYIFWFTAAGSLKNIQVAPRVFIKDEINGIEEEIAGVHQFSEPSENPVEDNDEKVYIRSVNYCRHSGPYHRSTNIDGEYVSFQLYGTLSGINCRRKIAKLKVGEGYKGRFGVYLSKDFIPVSKSNLMSNKNFHHFHLILNSQNFDLTADRNNICNKDSVKVKWIFDNDKKIINEDIVPLG